MNKKEYLGTRVLVLDANNRQAEIIMQELHKLGCVITTVNNTKLDIGYTSHYPQKRIILRKSNNYLQELKELLDREIMSKKYDAVMPILEETVEMLNQNRAVYERFVKIIATDPKSFDMAYDKQKTMDFCMDNGIPCPITKRQDESLDSFLDKVEFPIVVKPRKSHGSIGFHCVKDREALDELLKTIDITQYVVQEFIPQTDKQIITFVMCDKNSNIKTCLISQKVRWFPLDGGASTLLKTFKDDKILDICTRLASGINYQGNTHVDLIVDPRDGVPKVLEINGRVPASIKILYLAKIPFMKQLLDNAFDKEVEPYLEYKNNIKLCHFLADCMCFVKSRNRFKFKPAFWKTFFTKDMVFSFRDPLPFFSYTISHIRTLKKDMNERKR